MRGVSLVRVSGVVGRAGSGGDEAPVALPIGNQPHENLKSRVTAQGTHLESSRLTPVTTRVPLGTCL